jgi:hypothetical protein
MSRLALRGRLSKGERISGGSAILLFAFMLFNWYGVGIVERPNLLFYLRIFEDGGNAWQTLEVTPVVLALVIAVTVGAAVRRLIGRDWEPPVSPGAVVFVLGALAGCLILVRIVFPPDLGGEVAGFTFEATLKAGIFLALAAACGIAYGGGRAMQEEGASFADLLPFRHRDKRHLRTRGGR